MKLEEPKPNKILRGPVFAEPVEIIVTVPMGGAVKLVGRGLPSGKVVDTTASTPTPSLSRTPTSSSPSRARTATMTASRRPKVPPASSRQPSKPSLMNGRRRILLEIQQNGSVTSGWCRKSFGVALLTVQRDFAGLADLGLIERKGKGRAARFVLKENR